jgi:origin recognition complex subunit 3
VLTTPTNLLYFDRSLGQLAHLKHFTSDPLTALVHSTPSAQLLAQPEAAKFVESLQTRLESGPSLKAAKTDLSAVSDIMEVIDKVREDFHSRARDMRVRFGVIRTVQAEFRRWGYKGLEWEFEGEGDVGVNLDVMIDLLRGRLGRSVRQLGTIVK